MDDFLENLSFYKSPLFRFIRLAEAVFDEGQESLTLRFIYSEAVEGELDELKSILEKEVKDWLKGEMEIGREVPDGQLSFVDELDSNERVGGMCLAFEYEKRYIDEDMLALKIRQFLEGNFGVLLVGFGDEDVCVTYDGEVFATTLHMPQDVGEYVRHTATYRDFIEGLQEDYFAEFNFEFRDKVVERGGASIDELEAYISEAQGPRVDKSMKIRGLEYFLGKPIKERPIKIEFLKVSPHDQVIAGKIMYLTRRTYKKKTGEIGEGGTDLTEEREYWSFVLDDGSNRAQCVFFPTQKTKAPFEKLVDGTAVALIGIQSERNGRVSFMVSGVSWAEL